MKTQVNKKKLNKTLHDMELSPFTMHAVPDHSIIKHAKKKMKQAKSKHEETQMYLKQKLARVLPGINDLNDTSSEEELSKKVKQKAEDMDRLMKLLKDKMNISNRPQKIQLLTLVRDSCSRTSTK